MKKGLFKGYFLLAIFIVVGGFILFNFAFILTALVMRGTMLVMRMPENMAPPSLARFLAFALILFMSWLVFKSGLNHTFKATFLTMPLMTVLVLLGLSLYNQPKWMLYGAGAGIILVLLAYLYKKRLPWVYYFATIYVAILGIYIMVSGIDI